MHAPRKPLNQLDPGLPEGVTPDEDAGPEDVPSTEGAPLYDWEIPEDTPNSII